MSEFTLDDFKLTELYLGVDPDEYEDDLIPSFTGKGTVPISWMFFLNPDDIVTRQEIDPNSWNELVQSNSSVEMSMDKVEEYLKEPIGFRTTLPEAKARILQFKTAFKNIPYIWSYFRVLDVLDTQLDRIVTDLADNIPLNPIKRSAPEPDKPRSQVKIDEDTKGKKKKGKKKKEKPKVEEDNPFAGLEDFGFDTPSIPSAPSTDSKDEFNVADMLMGLDDDILSELEVATEYDKDQEEYREELERKAKEVDPSVLPVIIIFKSLADAGFGYRIGKIPVILDRLLHHAEREGRMTRIMQDYLQDIFRDLKIPWRITGLLAEDFVQSDPSTLPEIMLGTPSPFVLIRESFDLLYWSNESLQIGDERLMYTLTTLPSEEIHRAIRENRLQEIKDRVGMILVNTQSVKIPKLSLSQLREAPVQSNIWGFRVLIVDVNGEQKPTTFLCEDPTTSWEKDFVEKVKLPGVLIDWNIEYLARFQEFSDADNYRVVMKYAKDIEDCFLAFTRWVRRHNLLYRNRYGVRGTVLYLRDILQKTDDKELGQMIFDILTNLTELGISDATEVLADENVVNKLAWLYSI